MLQIIIPEGELYDEVTREFVYFKGCSLQLEHSLVAISKWESKWHKAFLSDNEKTHKEILDYIRCMTITQNVNPLAYNFLTKENYHDVEEYINDSHTATIINNNQRSRGPKDTMTSEVIYYYMIALQIPFECQKWHLNRLLKLIQVCNIKNEPPRKMSQSEIANRNKALNAERRKRLNTSG